MDTAERSRMRILILEDMAPLTVAIEDAVAEVGCEPLVVATPDEAIGLLAADDTIRIVVADLDVKGAPSGMALASAIRDRWPPVELILLSTFPHLLPAATLPSRSVVLDKMEIGTRLAQVIGRFAPA